MSVCSEWYLLMSCLCKWVMFLFLPNNNKLEFNLQWKNNYLTIYFVFNLTKLY